MSMRSKCLLAGSKNISAVYSPVDTTGNETAGLGGWTPAAPLQRSDADVTLFMLAQNAVAYLAPSDDPWMPAHQEGLENGAPVWVGDHDVNLMGCIDQYQICNPSVPGDAGCTDLSGAFEALLFTGLPQLKMNDYQLQTVIRLLQAPFFRSMYWAVQGRGASALNGKLSISKVRHFKESTPDII
jgi:hypothetical protein